MDDVRNHMFYLVESDNSPKLPNKCANLIIFKDKYAINNKILEKYSKYFKSLKYSTRIEIEYENRKIFLETHSTLIDRTILEMLSLEYGDIEFLCYEKFYDPYGRIKHLYMYEKYVNGIEIKKQKYKTEKFYYLFARELNLVDEINHQIKIVIDLISSNGYNSIYDVDDLESLTYKNVQWKNHFMYSYTWFFDFDALKNYLGG